MNSQPQHDLDFGRSFLTFSTTRVNHTPRLRIDSTCTLSGPDGRGKTYFATCACIGEAMYVPTGLIHEPVCEFNLIAAPRDEFLMIKKHADSAADVRSAHRFGDVMPTHDGKGAKVIGLDVQLVRFRHVEPITTYGEFREALLGGRVIHARTSYTEDDGTRVVLEYPANTTNVAHDREAWQVDAGPIVMPTPGAASDNILQVSRLDLAYLVFNRFDYAEAVLRQPSPIGKTGAATLHYTLRHTLSHCRHELFAVS